MMSDTTTNAATETSTTQETALDTQDTVTVVKSARRNTTAVIVPVHNQEKNMLAVVHGYLKQSLMPTYLVFVLDRCTDSSKQILEVFTEEFAGLGTTLVILETDPNITGFGAGRTRDHGVDWVLANTETGCFVFTDGDCIPHPLLVEKHKAAQFIPTELEGHESNNAVVVCGARFDRMPDNSLVPDPRLVSCYNSDMVFLHGFNRYVLNPVVVENSWACWSCNMSLNYSAVLLTRKVNKQLTGIERVFCSVFDGNWGGEDGFVALTLFRTGNHVVMLNPLIYVTHIWHERTRENNSHLYLVEAMDQSLRTVLARDLPAMNTNATIFHGLVLPTAHNYYDLAGIRGIESCELPMQAEELLDRFNPPNSVLRNSGAWFLARTYIHLPTAYTPSKLSDEEGKKAYKELADFIDLLKYTPITIANLKVMQQPLTDFDWARIRANQLKAQMLGTTQTSNSTDTDTESDADTTQVTEETQS
jgi:glycosyltransferase involved in cell wall biosynthesis